LSANRIHNPDSSLLNPDSSQFRFCGFWASEVVVESTAEILVSDRHTRILLVMSFASLPRVVFSVGVAALLSSFVLPARAEAIQWVTVGDPGTVADTTGSPNPAGTVGYVFKIMTFEWKNSQYVDFLNAVDPDGTNPNSVYNGNMGGNARGGISFTSGAASGSKYAVRSNMGDKPVNFVSWFNAARVANWLHNGGMNVVSTDATAGAPQNTGAYTLGTATSGMAPAKNIAAQYWIPTENEWYKAAYFKGSGTNTGYWQYPTQVTGTAPNAVGATTVGTGSSGGVSPVTTGNFVNSTRAADWNSQDGNVTSVGTNGGPSAYGAFDMGGNVYEWNDLDGTAGTARGIRGGSWLFVATEASSSIRYTDSTATSPQDYGFRLASPVAVPEPSTWVMAGIGIACAGWGAIRRRKRA
jgi:formylglycine-generating enzyme required for sulfatase activity